MPLPTEVVDTFLALLEEAKASADPEPTAMSLATADARGRVAVRMVLLKGFDAEGARFYSNYHSRKGEEIAAHPQLALCMHWKHIRDGVQVRMAGSAERLTAAESDAYFASRARSSQIGAWASLQSQTLAERDMIDARVERYEREFEGRDVPRPEHWGGYRVRLDAVEFWYGQRHRLHDRHRWERDADGAWHQRLLYP